MSSPLHSSAAILKTASVTGLLILSCLSCKTDSPEPIVRKPNVVLLVVETLRTDHLSLYGYDKPTTPNMVRLADESLVFERAVCQGNWTNPSVATLMTSLYPSSHRFVLAHESAATLNPEIVTLAETLRDAGYATAAVQTNFLLPAKSGIAQGFDDYIELEPESRAELVNRAALEWIEREPRDPFFLYLHYYDPHANYLPPDGYMWRFRERARNLVPQDRFEDKYDHIFMYEADGTLIRDLNHYLAAYDGSIAYVDEMLGELIDRLDEKGYGDDTIVIIVSDHGEEFQDHGGFDHGYNLYDYMIGAALQIRFPERFSGRVPARVGLIDVAPTLLDYMNIDAPAAFQGHSFLHLARDPRGEHSELVFSEGNGIGTPEKHEWSLEIDQKCVYRGRHKLIHTMPGDTVELYDLLEDPREQHDLAQQMPQLVEELKAELGAFAAYTAANSLPPVDELELSDEERKKLKALGYLR